MAKNEITNEMLFEAIGELKVLNTKTNADIIGIKGDIADVRKEMADGFADVHTRLDFITTEVEDIKTKIEAIAKRTKDDDGMLVTEVERLKKRVRKMEHELTVLKNR